MTNVIPFASEDKSLDDTVRKQACLWLARLDAGASEEEIKSIGAWLNESSDHLAAFMELAELWDQMSVLEELSTVFPLKEYAPCKSGKFPFNNGMRLVLTSLIFSVVCLGALSGYFLIGKFSGNFQQRYATAVGQQLTVDLLDGSQVKLNTATTIDVDFDGSTRRIVLEKGEALFQVAKDRSRPFQVFAGRQMVEAVGTAFSVYRADSSELEVMVSEGKVMLYRRHADMVAGANASTREPGDDTSLSPSVPLTAGQYVASSESRDGVVRVELSPDQVETRLSWRHGMFLFRDDPLEQVLSQVARYTTINIEAAEEIRAVRVDGYFRVDDIDGLLAAIENNFAIDVQRVGKNKIYLAPRQSSVN